MNLKRGDPTLLRFEALSANPLRASTRVSGVRILGFSTDSLFNESPFIAKQAVVTVEGREASETIDYQI
jgi:hypothetical protein